MLGSSWERGDFSIHAPQRSSGQPLRQVNLPQGTLDMVILQVVAACPVHGYALAHRIRLISRDILQIQQGSLYPALHRLENRGFLAAEWKESETGRDAKFDRLTLKGRALLAAVGLYAVHRDLAVVYVRGSPADVDACRIVQMSSGYRRVQLLVTPPIAVWPLQIAALPYAPVRLDL